MDAFGEKEINTMKERGLSYEPIKPIFIFGDRIYSYGEMLQIIYGKNDV